MPKPIPERIDAIVTVLERLAADAEVIRQGVAALALSLPDGLELQRRLLVTQASALERMSIGLGMVRDTTESLREIHAHAGIIMEEAAMAAAAGNDLDRALSRRRRSGDPASASVTEALERLGHATAAILGEAAPLAGAVPPSMPGTRPGKTG